MRNSAPIRLSMMAAVSSSVAACRKRHVPIASRSGTHRNWDIGVVPFSASTFMHALPNQLIDSIIVISIVNRDDNS